MICIVTWNSLINMSIVIYANVIFVETTVFFFYEHRVVSSLDYLQFYTPFPWGKKTE